MVYASTDQFQFRIIYRRLGLVFVHSREPYLELELEPELELGHFWVVAFPNLRISMVRRVSNTRNPVG